MDFELTTQTIAEIKSMSLASRKSFLKGMQAVCNIVFYHNIVKPGPFTDEVVFVGQVKSTLISELDSEIRLRIAQIEKYLL